MIISTAMINKTFRSKPTEIQESMNVLLVANLQTIMNKIIDMN